uniref:uncharacterized protein LOC122596383 n=1 Tax=Erigeron canadensis TaxID=72917 RepID=UPI001CB8E4A3|nr:uncharacterized protein LOC122596383 [Erigeron canadensis]
MMNNNNGGVILKAANNNSLLFQIPPLLHSNKTHHHSFFSIKLLPRLPSFHLKLPSSSPSVFASTKGKTNTPFDDSDFEEDDEEEDDVIVPLRNMRQWVRNKPLGFGEGKVYDTSVEDKLLQELEQSKVAQIANLNNLKKLNSNDENQLPKQKVPQVVPNGTRVRLINLPKKKNIHRDLQSAFKPFTGIINIIPAVTGNEKTREPVCKGSAFVDFKSEEEANRFVDTFSTQPITFGKVQKQIRCEIIKPSLPNPVSAKPPAQIREKPLPVSNPTLAVNSSTSNEIRLDPYVEDGAFDKFKNGDDDLVSATDEYNLKTFGNIDNVVQEKNELEAGSESSKKQLKVTVKRKKAVTGKKKAENTPKLNIPGSANRLKMKEKALLSGVFSKYGGDSAMAAKGTD